MRIILRNTSRSTSSGRYSRQSMISRRRQSSEVPTSVDPIRSKIMRAVGRVDTKPEMVVRRMLHQLGFRFRLHRKELPGTPDIVLPKYRTAIFVHGCFWHRHRNCRKATIPKTRVAFWANKFEQNVERDRRTVRSLRQEGWSVLIVWECETDRPDRLGARIVKHLDQQLRLARDCGDRI